MSENLSPEAVKANLKNAPRRKVGEIEIEGESGTVKLVLRRVPMEALIEMRKSWKKEGLLTEKDEPRDEEAALEMNRRTLAQVLYLPSAVRPLYGDPNELVGVPWTDELWKLPEVQAALGSVAKGVENAKGN